MTWKNKEYKREYEKTYRIKNRDKRVLSSRLYYIKNREILLLKKKRKYYKDHDASKAYSKKRYDENRDKILLQRRIRHKKDPINKMINDARYRAKKNSIPFNITKDDISIPKLCPILGISISVSDGSNKPWSPTIDKIDPKLGYVKGNVQVICHKANMMKSDATKEELINFANWIITNLK